MGTVPTPLVYVTGQVVTAAQLNGSPGGTWGAFVLGPPDCQVRQSVAQSLTTSTWTDLLFDTEDIDPDLWHSVASNTGRITPQTAGWIRLGGGAGFAVNATGYRGTRWSLNGTAINGSQAIVPAISAGSATLVAARTVLVQVNGSTDFVTLQGFQSSGASLATTPTADAQSSITAEWRGTT